MILSFFISILTTLTPSLAAENEELQKALNNSSTYKEMKLLNKSDFDEDVVRLFRNIKNSAPGKTHGDFNGDKKKDTAFLVKSKKEVLALIALREKGKVLLIKVDSWPRNPKSNLEDTYLSLLPSNKVNFKLKKISQKRDLIQIETYLGSVKAYYLYEGKAYPYKGEVP